MVQGVKAVFAHPYYPQDKGKVERAIRNVAEELVNIICIFHKLLIKEEIDSCVCEDEFRKRGKVSKGRE